MPNSKFEEDKALLIEACSSIVANVDAVIMYGGYGRGEGAWINSEGKEIPYNDYDILVISDSLVERAQLSQLRKNLAKRIGISWVDISIMKKNKLKKLKHSIFNFDLKNGSEVIYGDKDIKSIIPKFEASKIPLKDIRILFFTRLFTLIGAIKLYNIKNGFDNGQDVMFFKNQLAKAILACVDCLLILKGQYNSSYKIRVKTVVKIYSFTREEEELFLWALNEKLKPSSEGMNEEDTSRLYRRVEKIYRETMLNGLSQLYNHKITNSELLVSKYKQEFSIRLRKFYYKLRGSNYFDRVLAADIIQAQFLFCNIFSDSYDKKLLNSLFDEQSIEVNLPLEDRFELLRLKIVKMRLAL
jgi:hypothetical protein